MFVAKYRGNCGADCDDPIEPGDHVEYVGNVLVHCLCAQEDIVVEKHVADRRGKFEGTTLDDMGY